MILSGRQLAKDIRHKIGKKIQEKKYNIQLVIIQIGNNPASTIYVKNKQKACEKAHIGCTILWLDTSVTQHEVATIILDLNQDVTISGILIQSPVSNHLDFQSLTDLVDPMKDVDGLNYQNIGKVVQWNNIGIQPATPRGIMALLKHYEIWLEWKNVVVIGKSLIVWKPISSLLLHAGATVTNCHSKTKYLSEHLQIADIIISATGVKNLITAPMLSDKKIIIDVGISRNEDGTIQWDCEFEALKEVHDITPVPGWVGPMTIASLLLNLVTAYEIQHGL